MNKKGFTVIELIVSFALVMIVVVMLLQIIMMVKNLYVNAGIKTELLNKQAIMNRKISQKFSEKNIKAALRCGTGCLTFIYEDHSSSTLIIDKNNGKFTFTSNDSAGGTINYTTKLVSGSNFGNIDISNETVTNVSDGKNNSIIHIKVPVKHPLVDGDFGVNAVYQYDSRITAISGIVFDEQNMNQGGTIVLKESSDMTFSSLLDYVDPGYYVIDSSGNICEAKSGNACDVTVTGTVGKTPNTTYTLTFNLIKDGVTVDTKVRRVLVIDDASTFDYTGEYQIYTAPKKGNYKVELWGAAGSSTQKGSYVSGEIALEESEKLYLYIGNQGSSSTFNDGRTDIRTKSGDVSDTTSMAARIIMAPSGLNSTFETFSVKAISNYKQITGSSTMPNPRSSGDMTGNSSDGYARIVLVSVIS